jgi:hypothetical protein
MVQAGFDVQLFVVGLGLPLDFRICQAKAVAIDA